MPVRLNFQVIYLLTSVIISLYICGYAWRNQKMRVARTFAAACLTSVFWMAGDIIGRLGDTLEMQWFGEIVRFVGVAALPVALFVFIYRYCGKHLSRSQIIWLSVLPIISWLVLVTNPWHLLFFKTIRVGEMNSLKVEYGYYFWFVFLPYSYGLLCAGFITALLEIGRASRHYRKQILILFLSLCIPFSVNVVGVFKLLGQFSYTSLSFAVFFMIMAVAIFRYRFLFSHPIAYETVFQKIRDGVVILDHNNTIMDINPAAATGLGKSPGEIIGQSFEKAFEPWKDILGKYLSEPDLQDAIELDFADCERYILLSITPLERPDGTLNGRILTLRDITDRKQYQISLETLAFHDPLTRIANRRKFQEEVENALEKSKISGESVAVLYFDLNRFKAVNDTFGHETGDEFLKYVAARVASVLRKPDLLARLGGDEFAALLHNCDAAGMEIVLERMLENVQRPFKVGEHTLIADLSIGTAFYPADGDNMNELLRHADAEMYLAKQQKYNAVLPQPETKVSKITNDYLS